MAWGSLGLEAKQGEVAVVAQLLQELAEVWVALEGGFQFLPVSNVKFREVDAPAAVVGEQGAGRVQAGLDFPLGPAPLG